MKLKKRKISKEDSYWQAIINRDSEAKGFVYSVRTTGVYCRASCPSRLPLRKNVYFYSTSQEAEMGGYRPCKRCHPREMDSVNVQAQKVTQACRLLEQASGEMGLKKLAQEVGWSPFHLLRIFKKQMGVTPKEFASSLREKRVREKLVQTDTVAEAIYQAGYQSNSRFYEGNEQFLGMTPKAFRSKGKGVSIRFALGECWLGSILVAASDKGICAISLGDNPESLIQKFQEQFSAAQLVGGDPLFEKWVAEVVGFVSNPHLGLHLPLDIQGSAFQIRVWEALRKIHPGSTLTYTELAKKLGLPKSVRAVGKACATNPLAVAIPCHRVVATNGSLRGYRWGIERKKQLLQKERE